MNLENNHIDDTTNTFTAMASEMSAHSVKKTIKNLFCVVIILLSSVLIALLFTLPVFQTSHMTVSGCVNFQANEIVTMANLDGYHLNLLFDVEEGKKTLLENAQGLILDASFSTNGFVSQGSIVEDYPVAKCGEEVYFSSGKQREEIYSSVNHLSLSQEVKNRLIIDYDNEMNGSLPEIHFPTGTEATKENAILAAKRLTGVSLTALKYIHGIQFINEQGDVNWDNVATAIVKYDGEYYQFRNLRSELFSSYFTIKDNLFPEVIIKEIKAKIASLPDFKKTTFTYQDDQSSVEAYPCYATYNDKAGTVRILPYTE